MSVEMPGLSSDRPARLAEMIAEAEKAAPVIDEACARAAHEANRAYCIAIGDLSQPSWDDAPEWQKASARLGVGVVLVGATPEESHASWMAQKVADGWTYGAVKDPEAKRHPCMVPYAELPVSQRVKDDIFGAVVHAVAEALTP